MIANHLLPPYIVAEYSNVISELCDSMFGQVWFESPESVIWVGNIDAVGEITMTEKEMQAWIRIHAASKFDSLMMRNNSGVLLNPDTRTPVRFGLGNDSQQVNKVFKSSDLIGVTPVKCMCGHTYGVFTAIEVKHSDAILSHRNPIYAAQRNFVNVINKKAGLAGFVKNQKDFYDFFDREVGLDDTSC